MSVGSYALSKGATRWYYIIDLPAGPDGKRRQKKQRGFKNQPLAEKAEKAALETFKSVELSADGSVAAELEKWLSERGLDIAETTVSNYRDIFRAYVAPHIGTVGNAS